MGYIIGACVQKVPAPESAIQPSHPRVAHHANFIACKTLQLCFGHDSLGVFEAISCQKSEPHSQTPFKLSPFLNPRQTNGSKASRERNIGLTLLHHHCIFSCLPLLWREKGQFLRKISKTFQLFWQPRLFKSLFKVTFIKGIFKGMCMNL